VLLGAAVGQAFGHGGAGRLAHYANAVLLLPGAGLLAAGVLLRPAGDTLFGGPFAAIPPEVLIRAGACLCIVSGMAHLSRLVTRLPHLFGAVAQETLLIYFVHLCIVYGSVWNTGLAQVYGEQLAPLPVVAVVAALVAAMTVLAWRWNAIKHRSPRAARWIAVGAAAALVAPLV
jgi:hypothetical protein